MKAPRISVITPSFNQGPFLEDTLRSVLDQQWPALEYIVVDGASTDGSADIIARHQRHLAWWTTEPDRGQSHAINKGLARCTGDIVCWLNSDDCLEPGALRAVAEGLGEPGASAVVGDCLRIDVRSRKQDLLKGAFAGRRALLRYWETYTMHQPSVFWRREVLQKVGLLDESLHLAMDYDYWLRISRHFAFRVLGRTLSRAHWHAAAKTGAGYDAYLRERRAVAWREARVTGELATLTADFLKGALGHELDALLRPVVQGLRRRRAP